MGRKVSGSLKNREPFCAPQKENPCKFMIYKGLSFFKWCGAGSNRRHKDFQSFALPTELPHHPGSKMGADCKYRPEIHTKQAKPKEQRSPLPVPLVAFFTLSEACSYGRESPL